METISEIYGNWGKFHFYLFFIVFAQMALVSVHTHIHMVTNQVEKCVAGSCHPGCTGEVKTSAIIIVLGQCFGDLIGGYLADRFGRTRTITAAIAFLFIFGTVLVFVENCNIFMALRFFEVASSSTALSVALVLMLETFAYRYEVLLTFLYVVLYKFGFTVAVMLMKMVNNYASIQLVTSLAMIKLIIIYLFAPDSLIWLLAAGKKREARNTVIMAAGIDNVSIEEFRGRKELIADILRSSINPQDEISFFTLLRQKWRPLLALAINQWAVGLGFSRVQTPLNNMLGFRIAHNRLGVLRSLILQMVAALGLLQLHDVIGWRAILITANVTIIFSNIYFSINIASEVYELGVDIISTITMGVILPTIAFHYCFLAQMVPTLMRARIMCAVAICSTLAAMLWIFASHWTVQYYYNIISVVSCLIAILACRSLPANTGKSLPVNIENLQKITKNEDSSTIPIF